MDKDEHDVELSATRRSKANEDASDEPENDGGTGRLSGEEAGHPAYEVGYAKPPKATRFKKGHSGNPKGRRRGTRNFRTYIREELEQKVTVKKDGRQQMVPKVKLIAMQLVNSSVKGNIKSIDFLLKLADLMGPDTPEAGTSEPMSDEDRQTVLGYLLSIGAAKGNNDREDSQ